MSNGEILKSFLLFSHPDTSVVEKAIKIKLNVEVRRCTRRFWPLTIPSRWTESGYDYCGKYLR